MNNDELDDILSGNVNLSKSLQGKQFFDISQVAVAPEHIRKLVPYLAMVSELEDVNDATAPRLLAKLSEGLNLASTLFASATYHYSKAKSNLKKIQGVCALERFRDYVNDQKNKGITVKETDSTRENFINIQDDVIAASNEVAYFEAVREQLGGNKMGLTMAISATKSIVYGSRTSDSLSGCAN